VKILEEEVENREQLEEKLSDLGNVPDRFSVAAEAIIFDSNMRWVLMKRGVGCRDEIGKLEGVGGSVEEQDESFRGTVKREIKEEAGKDVEVEIIDFFEVREDTVEPAKSEGNEKHWIIVSYLCKLKSGEPKIMEPEKNEGYYRKDIHKIDPEKLSSSSTSALQSLQNNWSSVESKIREV
jgi:NUDIX domain.